MKQTEESGRFLVATRDIKKVRHAMNLHLPHAVSMVQDSVVMVEEGVVVGPLYSRTVPVCLECLKAGPGLAPCSRCGWPVCPAGTGIFSISTKDQLEASSCE